MFFSYISLFLQIHPQINLTLPLSLPFSINSLFSTIYLLFTEVFKIPSNCLSLSLALRLCHLVPFYFLLAFLFTPPHPFYTIFIICSLLFCYLFLCNSVYDTHINICRLEFSLSSTLSMPHPLFLPPPPHLLFLYLYKSDIIAFLFISLYTPLPVFLSPTAHFLPCSLPLISPNFLYYFSFSLSFFLSL